MKIINSKFISGYYAFFQEVSIFGYQFFKINENPILQYKRTFSGSRKQSINIKRKRNERASFYKKCLFSG